jgi:beta-lactamase class A
MIVVAGQQVPFHREGERGVRLAGVIHEETARIVPADRGLNREAIVEAAEQRADTLEFVGLQLYHQAGLLVTTDWQIVSILQSGVSNNRSAKPPSLPFCRLTAAVIQSPQETVRRMRKLARFLLICVLFFAVALTPRAWKYARSQGPLPTWVVLAGVPPAGATLDEIAEAITRPYKEPVWVHYGEERLLLRPEEVGFVVDTASMLDEAEAQREGLSFWRGFVDEVLKRTPDPVDIPLSYDVDETSFDDWLSDLGERYDRPPTSATVAPIREGVPFTETVAFGPGEPGLELDHEASGPRIVEALAAPSPEAREAWLVLAETPPPMPDVSVLAEVLQERMDETPILSGVFVRHLASGQEVNLGGDVAYSGMSLIKVPIFLNVYRALDGPPSPETLEALTTTMTIPGASNYNANLLLAFIGDGDKERGAGLVSDFLHRLGLRNSFMAGSYDAAIPVPRIVTAANSRSDVSADPDPYMQTTPKEMGLLLEMLAKCAEGSGPLLAAYPGELTAEECTEVIGLLEMNPITTYIKAGLPEGTRLAHKHGFSEQNQSDAGIIWGPGGPYVLSISVYQPGWVEYRYSHPLIADMATATWQFFALWANARVD